MVRGGGGEGKRVCCEGMCGVDVRMGMCVHRYSAGRGEFV